jgi:hypothetical protein
LSAGNGRGDPEHKCSVKNDIACTGYEVPSPQQREVAIDEQITHAEKRKKGLHGISPGENLRWLLLCRRFFSQLLVRIVRA